MNAASERARLICISLLFVEAIVLTITFWLVGSAVNAPNLEVFTAVLFSFIGTPCASALCSVRDSEFFDPFGTGI